MKNSESPISAKTSQIQFPVLIDQAARESALDTTRSFLVQAPAGSGKTELLIRRFLKLLAEVDEPEHVLAITFTRAATAEMRTRVLEALETAAYGSGAEDEDPLFAIASAALKNNAARNWGLLEQHHRLNIQTIDSLCLNIAHRAPLLSRLGGALNPTEHAEPLYALAARRALAHLGGNRNDLSRAIHALLEVRDTSLNDCERLIAEMLAKRDFWGPALRPARETNWQEVREALEAPFRRERRRGITAVRNLLSRSAGIADELLELISHACANLEDDPDNDNRLVALKNITMLEELEGPEHWSAVCHFFLTLKGTWRRKPDARIGFPPADRDKIRRYQELAAELQKSSGALDLLCRVRDLPPASYSEEQWALLENILLILRYAVAELRVLFAEQGTVDFVELGLAARQALNVDHESPDSALPPALAWRHLLVDEFQDTSRAQYELLTLLVDQRDPFEPGTCFLVGDPMQSIYGFRQAEVELFERTRRHGLGAGLPLESLVLQTNFRSHAGLVDPLNKIFSDIFVPPSAAADYEVTFSPSVSIKPAPRDMESVRIAARFLSSRPTPNERVAGAQLEAEEVVREIQRARTSRPNPDEIHIAVLVRAKKHLIHVAQALRKAGVPYRAVEIEQLSERQEVQDLTSLTRSLLHPMDRIAWLSVLRAPWCGLTLNDLHILCGEDDRELARKPILQLFRQRIGLLSPDGRRRASRTVGVLEQGLSGMRHQVSFSSWVERVWRSLGGRECVDPTGYENARAYFRMLEELPPDGTGLERLVSRLFAEPDPRTDERNGVQLMTIHKAKGLGFDIVFMPRLHLGTEHHDRPLLNWLERTTLKDADGPERYEFLVAPIGRRGERDPLYRWISRQKKHREREEDKRLFYVACTRAKEKLHLLGAATIKNQNSGDESLSPGLNGSLLRTAWPALENIFRRQREEQTLNPAQAPPLTFSPSGEPVSSPDSGNETLKLRRLPSHWTLFSQEEKISTAAVLPEAESVTNLAPFERPGGALQARAIGKVVHALLEELTDCLLSAGIADLHAQIDGWRPRAGVLLRQAGLARAEAETLSATVFQALRSVLNDEVGRWILSPHPAAESEASWSVFAEPGGSGEPFRTLRGDRIFRAGAEPLSQEETHIWIVDYKTAFHGHEGLDSFLDNERQKYRSQLENYANTLRKVHGEEELPLRLALYYPLLRKLLWWEALSGDSPR